MADDPHAHEIRGRVWVISTEVPEGVVPPSTSMATPHPHPYVHLIFGPWEPSGHQCGDLQPGGCDEPVDERKVTARHNGVGDERLVGWELRECPVCTPGPDVPDEWRERLVSAISQHCRTHMLTVEGVVGVVLPLFAEEAERARLAEEREFTDERAIERCAVEAERAAIISGIKHYFAASDDPLYEDVKVLCGRIERGEYGARKEGR